MFVFQVDLLVLLRVCAAKCVDQAERDGVLIATELTRAIWENILVGRVVTVFQPADDLAGQCTLQRECNFAQILRCSGREPIVVLEPFAASSEGPPIIGGVLDITSNTGPPYCSRRQCRNRCSHAIMAIVVVRHERKLAGGVVGNHSVGQVSEVAVRRTFGSDEIVLDEAEFGAWRPGGREASGLPAVVVNTVVPA